MKKRILILILIFLTVPAALASWGFGLPECYGETFMGELKYKLRLLDDTPGQRIVIVGGSAAAFGADCDELSAAFPGYTALNLGMYAALGTTVMLDLTKNAVREGDIVILMPELSRQTMSDFFDPDVMWQGLDGAFSLLSRLPGQKLLRLAGAFPRFAAEKLRYAVKGEKPEPEGIYRRESFCDNGDLAAPGGNVMPLLYDELSPVTLGAELFDEAFIAACNEYATAVRSRGGEVYFAFAPINELCADGSAAELYSALEAALDMELIGDPADSIMDAGWFYDTNFHLNSAGRAVYTDSLIGALKAALGDAEAYTVALPAMPEPESAELFTGDDSDADRFTYLDLGDSYAVTGAESTAERLVVPTTYSGKPVAAIYAGAFSDCAELREIVIQKNIRSIAAGAFDGAGKLQRIVVENEKPASLRVGDGLLGGTTADIYVPEAAASAYKTDYFWSIYAARIRP